MERDYAAIEAALRLPYSTGPVEGNINRLKLIKRSGYGRAGFDLLRLRVLEVRENHIINREPDSFMPLGGRRRLSAPL